MGKRRKEKRKVPQKRPSLTSIQNFLIQDFYEYLDGDGERWTLEREAREAFIRRRRDLCRKFWSDRTSFVDLSLPVQDIEPVGENGIQVDFRAKVVYEYTRSWSDVNHLPRSLQVNRTFRLDLPEEADEETLGELSDSLINFVSQCAMEIAREAPVQEVLPPDPDWVPDAPEEMEADRLWREQDEEGLSLDPRFFRHVQGLDRQKDLLTWDLFPELGAPGPQREQARIFWDGSRLRVLKDDLVSAEWKEAGLFFEARTGVLRDVPERIMLDSAGDLFAFLPRLARAYRDCPWDLDVPKPPVRLLWPAGRGEPSLLLWGCRLSLAEDPALTERSREPSALEKFLLNRIRAAVADLSILHAFNPSEQTLFYALAAQRKIVPAPGDTLQTAYTPEGVRRFFQRFSVPGLQGEPPLFALEDGAVRMLSPWTSDAWPPLPGAGGVQPAAYSVRDIPWLQTVPRERVLKALLAVTDPEKRWDALLEMEDNWSPQELLTFSQTPEGQTFLKGFAGLDRDYVALRLEMCLEALRPPQRDPETL